MIQQIFPVRKMFSGSYALCSFGAVLVAIVSLSSLCAPWITPYSPTAIDVQAILQPPSAEHFFGTECALNIFFWQQNRFNNDDQSAG